MNSIFSWSCAIVGWWGAHSVRAAAGGGLPALPFPVTADSLPFFAFIRWRLDGSAGRLTGLRAVAIIDPDIIMQTNVQTEDAIVQKTRELCETIVQQPQFQSIRQRVETFLADPEAQSQYECLSDLGQQLQEKQHQGLTLTSAEIAAFDR